MVRESDLKSFAEVVGHHRAVHAWPPAELAPGIVLRRRSVTVRDPKTQEPKATRHYLTPEIEDSRLYYFTLAEHNARPEDARNCPACNGAHAVRHGELVPGRPGFGTYTVCPNWTKAQRRCEWPWA